MRGPLWVFVLMWLMIAVSQRYCKKTEHDKVRYPTYVNTDVKLFN